VLEVSDLKVEKKGTKRGPEGFCWELPPGDAV
jgi:hypothetical protein